MNEYLDAELGDSILGMRVTREDNLEEMFQQLLVEMNIKED